MSPQRRIIIESPLNAPDEKGVVRNLRYLLWCCRAVYTVEGCVPAASHLIAPWFMNDRIPAERAAGIEAPWVWQPGDEHKFFHDLAWTDGMLIGLKRCEDSAGALPFQKHLLAEYAPVCWAKFSINEWPPHTPGFRVAPAIL